MSFLKPQKYSMVVQARLPPAQSYSVELLRALRSYSSCLSPSGPSNVASQARSGNLQTTLCFATFLAAGCTFSSCRSSVGELALSAAGSKPTLWMLLGKAEGKHCALPSVGTESPDVPQSNFAHILTPNMVVPENLLDFTIFACNNNRAIFKLNLGT